MCGAWSFDAESKICYLHSVNSCCNQINKSIKAETFISGFVCPFCWSTKNDCPCPEKELRSGIETQFASAGSLVQHGSATVRKGLSDLKKNIGGLFGPSCKKLNAFSVEFKVFVGTIQVLRKQKGGWVGYAKCLHFLTWWVGGSSKMLT